MYRKIPKILFILLGTLILFYLIPFVGQLLPMAFHPGITHLLVINPVVVFSGILFCSIKLFSVPWKMFIRGLLPGILFIPTAFLYYNSSAVIYGFYYIFIGLFAVLISFFVHESKRQKARQTKFVQDEMGALEASDCKDEGEDEDEN